MRWLALLPFLATPVAAEIELTFRDGAPKDRFTVTNTSACALDAATIGIDFAGSSGQLIFDTTASGAGVEVFQPLEIVEGAPALASIPKVADGDTALALPVSRLAPGATIAFTIDVDDTLGGREITVSGSEIAGAAATLSTDGFAATARFSASGVAAVSGPPCA
ncbi:hypothetical protein [Pseudaestuariivita atlantica]|uniref:Aggregation factor core n=1 Tax=Pseudaestuariivita atlantica TaxID=1317121 RepID=A0A0L1JTM5_9RHOB|nr:hypothetical protein [Pseudaestuariivita atlantica]KNG94768.1 hypothetical protein ATO11_05090 [Pseudaestuariivita atlantica]